jgi:hypothetical protein
MAAAPSPPPSSRAISTTSSRRPPSAMELKEALSTAAATGYGLSAAVSGRPCPLYFPACSFFLSVSLSLRLSLSLQALITIHGGGGHGVADHPPHDRRLRLRTGTPSSSTRLPSSTSSWYNL